MGKISCSIMLILISVLLIRVAKGAIRCGVCGKTPVPYPLSTRPDCGDQAYKIRCTAGSLWFDALKGSSYMITSIDPLGQRLIIRPPSVIPNTCLSNDLHSQGIHLDGNLPFNITGSNTILLLNCTDAMLHLTVPLNCTQSCICHSYTSAAPEMAACNREKLCCAFKAGSSQFQYGLPIQSDTCLAYQTFVNLDPTLPVGKWPAPGMEIMWMTPREPICISQADCRELPDSLCMPDPANVARRRCFCKAGRIWDPTAGYCRMCRQKGECKVRKKKKVPMIGGISAIGVVTLLVFSIIVVYVQRPCTTSSASKTLVKEREEILNANSGGKSAKIFSGKEIKKATNNFAKENLLGSGGFGEVYRGTLDDGTITAVKRAKPGNTKGTEQVLNEVRILCQVNHRSLVRLLGCCVELEQPLLIFEYIANGTLFDHLHGFRLRKWTPLNWLRRLKIAHQTADGLAYLHSSSVPPIYHRDVKSSNILLDEKLDAKVSDFGLSRLVEVNENEKSHIYTSAQGTLGYLDPEYYLNFQLTDRSDVYSFGVVLLELLTSKKAIDFNREEESVNLVVYMKRIISEEKLLEAIDPILKEGASKVELETMQAVANLAAGCLDDKRQNRPSMKEVADEIDYIIGILTADNNSKTR